MIILDKPYVSEFLKETIRNYNLPVLKTQTALDFIGNEGVLFLAEDAAIEKLKNNPETLVYTNSENAINWIVNNLGFTDLPGKIDLFKDKAKFRQLIDELYPNFFYKAIPLGDLKTISIKDFPKPFVIKPSVGFFSFGVYTVTDENSWKSIVNSIYEEVEAVKEIYPVEVLNTTTFIAEEFIRGTEYAFDAYFDSEGKPVILNILKHIFSSDADNSDRVYLASAGIIHENLERFGNFLKKIGNLVGLKNFPMHVEVRVDDSGKIMPIEINPLRFGGWCTTADFTFHAYGFNSYNYLLTQQKPDWKRILKDKEGKIFSIIVLNNSTGEKVENISSFDYEKLSSCFEKPLFLSKADHKNYHIFGFVFAETGQENFAEIENILKSDLTEFITLK
jgi:hypothetical protein